MDFSNKIYPHAFLEFCKQNAFFSSMVKAFDLLSFAGLWEKTDGTTSGWILSPDVALNKAMLAGLTSSSSSTKCQAHKQECLLTSLSLSPPCLP